MTTTVPSLLILGTDAVLAAQPATPVQLAHACAAIGYDSVIPATWGDELIAFSALERLRETPASFVQCSCPRVSARLGSAAEPIESLVLRLIAPPAATALYLRALHAPRKLTITFVGACPSGAHESIDNWISIAELVSEFERRGVAPASQPTEFDSVIPPDRRRFFSEPGGAPSREGLSTKAPTAAIAEVAAGDIVEEIAQRLLADTATLVDVAVALGCSCSGAVSDSPAQLARARVRGLEPPRAYAPVVDHAMQLDLNPRERPTFTFASPPAPAILESTAPDAPVLASPLAVAVEAPPRRRSPQGLTRPVLGVIPVRRTESGRQLPRAYVARRRSSPRNLRLEQPVDDALPDTSDVSAELRPPRYAWWMIGAAGFAIGVAISWLFRLT